MILTVDEVRVNLGYDVDQLTDGQAIAWINAAEQMIKNYITDPFDESDSALKNAAHLLIGFFDEYRNAEKEMPANGNYLPMQVVAVLYKYRSPTVV